MPLDDSQIASLMPATKPYKIADGLGLYLAVSPSGAKLWRLKYRFSGKEGTLSFGAYPETGIDAARQKRDEARRLLAEGINPSEHTKAIRARELAEQEQQQAARFSLSNDGALYIHLGKRHAYLTPSETAELRDFLDATRAVTMEG
ncbi:Arm DNA-binding domain-containing protein [Zoogloea sp.]|uniref:Arm DNA-binding domain-containing protein n=1 Tax=Zoogloea sp. TaxID=49181 RepID=UPI0035B0740B